MVGRLMQWLRGRAAPIRGADPDAPDRAPGSPGTARTRKWQSPAGAAGDEVARRLRSRRRR